MKILVVCQFYYPENFVITNICEQLVKDGHDVTVLTGKPNYGYGYILPGYEDVKYEVINNVKIHRVNLIARKHSRISIIKNYLSFWYNAKRFIRHYKEQFDIVYSMSLSPVTILAPGNLYKKKHGVKHIVHCVDLWPESVIVTHAVKKNSLIYRFLYLWSKSLYRKADHVLIGSPSYEEYFHNVLKLHPRMTFLPQPSLVDEVKDDPIVYDSKQFNLLYCGNIGLIQLINLLPETLLKVPSLHLHIIGMGPKEKYLKEECEKLNIIDRITFYGPMPAKKASRYFVNADALYVPLSKEGFVGKTIPNKLIMSMAFKKPIIAILDGDGRKVLEKTKGGYFAEENVDSLVSIIEKMMKLSKKERDELGKKNYQCYLDHFTTKKVTEKLEQILADEIGQE